MTRQRSRVLLATFAVAAALAAKVSAQDRPSAWVFEVAAIKPHNPADTGGGFSFQHGRLTVSNTFFKILVMSAYDVKDFQISGGPNWIDSERFDILAQAPDDSDHRDLNPMLQALLADRFKLALHGRLERPACTLWSSPKMDPSSRGPPRTPNAPCEWDQTECPPRKCRFTTLPIHFPATSVAA